MEVAPLEEEPPPEAAEPAVEQPHEAAEPAVEEPPEAAEQAVEAEEPINIRPLRAPSDPTVEEIEAHEASGHTQFRAWCRACLAGAGRNMAHAKVDRPDVHSVPVLVTDYCFMNEAEEDGETNAKCMPILVCKFNVDKWMHSHAVPHKGTKHPWGQESSRMRWYRVASRRSF